MGFNDGKKPQRLQNMGKRIYNSKSLKEKRKSDVVKKRYISRRKLEREIIR